MLLTGQGMSCLSKTIGIRVALFCIVVPAVACRERLQTPEQARQTTASVVRNDSTREHVTMSDVENAQYQSLSTGTAIRLVDGTYQQPPLGNEDLKEYLIQLDRDHLAIGDINADGHEDAAVILVSRAGGSGTYRQLAILVYQDGGLVNVANRLLGDRVGIRSLAIAQGAITIEFTEWNGGEERRRTTRYRWGHGQLIEF
jgi:hypothetical protein